jgi:hypothetical protein
MICNLAPNVIAQVLAGGHGAKSPRISEDNPETPEATHPTLVSELSTAV